MGHIIEVPERGRGGVGTCKMIGVRLRGFSVRYSNFFLEPMDLSIDPGERVAVVGANGAGKSTTLKAIAGRLRDYEGGVELGGEDVRSRLPEIRARIGFLPEKLLGFGWMTVGEHLSFLSAFYPTWDHEYAEELLERLELPRASKVGTLSKGMAVKLSLVGAEAHRPPVLILDEPTSAIDPVMRRELLGIIDECAPGGGDRLVVFSSHILEDVEFIAERVVLMRVGRILEDVATAELRERDPGAPLSQILLQALERS